MTVVRPLPIMPALSILVTNMSIITSNITSAAEGLDNTIGSELHETPIMETCPEAIDADISMFTLVVHGILLTLTGVLGLCGNTISLLVLTKAKMRSSAMNCCLIGLTIFDMFVLTSSILMFGILTIADYYHSTELLNLLDFIIPHVIYPIGMIAQTGSIYCTVMVTVERFVAVCMPLRARSFITRRRSQIYICVVAVFAIIYNVPRFHEVKYKDCMEGTIVHTILEETELRRNPVFKQVYITWAYLIVMYAVPFGSLIVFNTFIYRSVHKANQQRSQMNHNQQKEISLAVMLLVVIAIFFVCNTLALVVTLLEIVDSTVHNLTQFSNFLVTVNSSVNFIIYCIYGKNFRKHFLKMFCAQDFQQVTSARVDSMSDSRSFSISGRTQSIRLSRMSSTYNNRSSLTRQYSIITQQNQRNSLQTQISINKEVIPENTSVIEDKAGT